MVPPTSATICAKMLEMLNWKPSRFAGKLAQQVPSWNGPNGEDDRLTPGSMFRLCSHLHGESGPMSSATILHADLDAFYASVEQLLNPELRGKPIAVGGGVVLAASYEAKTFGVHGGMSGWAAKELCPELIFTGGHFEEYQRPGDAAIGVLGDFTPLVERISIDEAFADVAGCEHLFGSPETIARTIRARVRDELGLPISIGIARTKHLAKVASQVAKPDGLVVVHPETELEFLHPLPVGLMWGVGPVTEGKLEDEGILTIGQLAEKRIDWVQGLLGHATGGKLSALAWNRDPRAIVTHQRARSA